MRYGSVCSGVEAATVAWHSLGWEPQWFSEIEKFPSAVLQHHYPDTPNYGDMTAFEEWPNDPIDVLVGGTPCQSFSVAGLRKGLADPRGNLMLTYLAIAARYQPNWLVWENVPGVLSSNRGRDFGTFLGALGQLGYGFAYRVLDAQYFGVAQRRRRVFVVGYLGDWKRAAAVLFERESLSGHPAPSRETREKVAGTVTTRSGNGGGGGLGTDEACAGYLQPTWPAKVASTLNAAFAEKQGLEDQHINGGAPLFVPAVSNALCARDYKGARPEADQGAPVIAFGAQNSAQQEDSVSGHVTPTLDKSKTPAVAQASAVRRLTPTECERLQGFPDNYTQIPYRNKPAESCPDGPRYKAMGNSMAVPVMRWIGERINMVEALA
jgi:DNA (cytosine-5)-methyltransferase 1